MQIQRITIRFRFDKAIFHRAMIIIGKARRNNLVSSAFISGGTTIQELEFECLMCGKFDDYSTYEYINLTYIEGDTVVRVKPVNSKDVNGVPITSPLTTTTSTNTISNAVSNAISNNKERNENMNYLDTIKKCMFNGRSTIMMFKDGRKFVVKQIDSDRWDPEIGIAMAIAKSLFGTRSKFTKYVDTIVRESYAREATKLTEKELATLMGDHARVINMEEEEVENKLKKNPTLSKRSLYTREYHYAKLFFDILLKEQERRKKKAEAKKKQQADIKKKKKKNTQ
jgi:hypothetical protein